ncbi:MAG: RNA-binding S4 domain-containing protein [bacterium]|nr:RNA-binding S4 domain-containing protein [bacterium]
MTPNSNPSVRLDKWLWYTRKVKTRSKATKLVKDGKIRVNTVKVSKASQVIRVDDVITATISTNVFILKVIELGSRRGPATEAITLYEDLTPAPVKQSAARPRRPERDKGAGRPTKRERRQTDRLRWNTLYDAGDE